MSCAINPLCPAPSVGTSAQTFTAAIELFAAAQCLVTENWPQSSDVADSEQFDFIIVGAGSAGSVVANRLTENETLTVLLIEAGGNPPSESIIPPLILPMYGSEYDWKYESIDNGWMSKGLQNNRMPVPRGKMLGGGSSMNSMIYIRGDAPIFQQWYDEGNTDWHPDVVSEYFKKLESLQNEELLQNEDISNFYGHDGPVVINVFNASSASSEIFSNMLDAYDEIGFKRVSDINAATEYVNRSSSMRASASNGARNSCAKAYLNNIQDRTNLKILKETLVTKVLLDDSLNAYGVEVECNGSKKTFLANKEVIISAGTIDTPKLLMQSGIGPCDHLESVNVTCIVDSPAVGQNLQEHTSLHVTIYADVGDYDDSREQSFEAIKYLYNRTGAYAANPNADLLAFYALDENATHSKFEVHSSFFNKNSSTPLFYFTNVTKFKSSLVDSIVEQNEDERLYLFAVNLLTPYSRGNVTLKSNDPTDDPVVDMNFFSDRRDLTDFVAAIKYFTKIVNTTYFQSINAHLGRIAFADCDDLELDSEEYWECITVNTVVTVYHPVGTAKMGPDATTSAVSSKLKVHGVNKLRVIDASIMPYITNGNTNSPSIMIGERGADLVKEDYST